MAGISSGLLGCVCCIIMSYLSINITDCVVPIEVVSVCVREYIRRRGAVISQGVDVILLQGVWVRGGDVIPQGMWVRG